MTAPTDLHDDRRDDLPVLLTIHDIAGLLRVHRTAAYARTRDPGFPDPLVISGACYRWYAREVLAYVDARRTPKRSPRPRTVDVGRTHTEAAVHAIPRPRLPRRRPAETVEAVEAEPSGASTAEGQDA